MYSHIVTVKGVHTMKAWEAWEYVQKVLGSSQFNIPDAWWETIRNLASKGVTSAAFIVLASEAPQCWKQLEEWGYTVHQRPLNRDNVEVVLSWDFSSIG